MNGLLAALLAVAVESSDDALLHHPGVFLKHVDLTAASCAEVLGGRPEAGLTDVHLVATIDPPVEGSDGRWTGILHYRLDRITVELPGRIQWQGMTDADRARAAAYAAAVAHHEAGHVRLALAFVDELRPVTITAADPDLYFEHATAQRDAAFVRFRQTQRDYDDLTHHGLRQDRAAGVLRGADTILTCYER